MPDGQMYQLTITAVGEVRDADGNLIEQNVPVESTIIVTEAQARELMEGQESP
jgi:hypothetical protein